MHREGIFEKHRLDTLYSSFVAGNVAQLQFGPVPQGYAWYVENFAFVVLGNSHTTIAEVAITPDDTQLPAEASWDNDGLVWGSPGVTAARFATVQPGVAWYMGPGHWLHLSAHGGTAVAGDVLSATAQIAVHQLDPDFIMSPEDAKQLRAAHEHLAAELAHSAVAERRAV